jgi:hypothetical protein
VVEPSFDLCLERLVAPDKRVEEFDRLHPAIYKDKAEIRMTSEEVCHLAILFAAVACDEGGAIC